MNRLIIVGSPRANGRCAHLGEMLFEACIDECPEDELYLAPVSELDIAGYVACDACKKAAQAAARARLAEKSGTEGAQADDAQADGGEVEIPPIPYCPRFDDDMLDLYEVLQCRRVDRGCARVLLGGAGGPHGAARSSAAVLLGVAGAAGIRR